MRCIPHIGGPCVIPSTKEVPQLPLPAPAAPKRPTMLCWSPGGTSPTRWAWLSRSSPSPKKVVRQPPTTKLLTLFLGLLAGNKYLPEP
jgi:hypothetical protein